MSISLLPKKIVKRVQDINLNELREQGIKLLIFDIDNTLVARKADSPEIEVLNWLKSAQQQGFQTCLMTNNRGIRISQFNLEPDEFYVCNAMKPLKTNFKNILRHFKTTPQETCMMGDQVFTDILGANRMGIYSILVDRLQDYGWFGRRCMHNFEDYLRRRFREQIL